MSIHDTDTEQIREQAMSFVTDLQECNYHPDYKERYRFLYIATPALYNMINGSVKRNIESGIFDRERFEARLESMLKLVVGIQNGEITQNAASEAVGTELAHEYVDVCKPDNPQR